MLRLPTFRTAAAAFCGSCAVLFLTINSGILARGASRWAVSTWDQWSYAVIAATVPWLIALMPFLASATIRRDHRWSWPTVSTAVIIVVWVVFIAYNIVGAGGAMNFTRTDVISGRKYDATKAHEIATERARLVALRAAIPTETRPAGLIRPLLKAEEGKGLWVATDHCREPGSASARKFCASYAKLASELGAAEELAKLTSEIAGIDRHAGGPVSEVVDPSAAFWARWTGLTQERVQDYLPLTTPLLLEVGSMTLLYFALRFWGFAGHRQVMLGGGGHVPQLSLPPAAADVREEVVAVGAAPIVTALPPPPADPITRGQELAQWFFAECVRPVASGGLPEARWYALYSEQCTQSNSTPIAINDFRQLAQAHGAVPVLIDGDWYYQRVLPLVPKEGAA